MTTPDNTSPTPPESNIVLRLVSVGILLAAAGVFSFWFFTCPCDRMPGGFLLGPEVDELVDDCAFANDVELCQIQIHAGLLPHSINLNCMAASTGELYLSCSQCDGKRWSNAVLTDTRARIRLGEAVYPVTVTRVTDPDELDRAWAARLGKLENVATSDNPAAPLETPRPDHWWSFRLVSRPVS